MVDNKLSAVAKHKWHQERQNADFAWDAFYCLSSSIASARTRYRPGGPLTSSLTFLLDVPVLTLTVVENRSKESNGRTPIYDWTLQTSMMYDQQYSMDHNEVELVYEVDEEEDALDGGCWK
jgi:hypothetical protein